MNHLNNSVISLFTGVRAIRSVVNNGKEVQLTNTLNTAHERAVALLMNEIPSPRKPDFEHVSSIEDTVMDGSTH